MKKISQLLQVFATMLALFILSYVVFIGLGSLVSWTNQFNVNSTWKIASVFFSIMVMIIGTAYCFSKEE